MDALPALGGGGVHQAEGGEQIQIGTRSVEVLHIPGHSLGHACLWSPADGLLFSGDHLLGGVTPAVTFEQGFDANPLRSYLDSLREEADLRPRLGLPGHGQPFGEGARRTEAIIRNKLRRLDAIRAMIERAPCTVTDVANTLVAKGIVPFQRTWPWPRRWRTSHTCGTPA